MDFETKTVIEQSHFTQTADAILARAINPEEDIVETLEDVSKLTTKLDEVKAGTVHIEPPLNPEDLKAYSDKANQIISLGRRTVEALESADSERVGHIGRLFKGMGLASKR
jgi:hypothetical protein